MRLNGKIAIVTGAGSGFGKSTAKLFAEEGARVCIADIEAARAKRVADEIGGATVAAVGDVSKASGIETIVETTRAAFGDADIIVNNAGVTHRNQPMLEVDEETFDKIYGVNVKALYLMARATVPAMRSKGGGSIINVSSTAALRPRPGLVWYNGSKGAANVISKAMALELAPDNIRVNDICQVMGVTGMMEHSKGVTGSPENRSRLIDMCTA